MIGNYGKGRKTPEAAKAVADATWRAYVRARDAGHEDWLDDAKKFDAFYLGDQWEKDDAAALEAAGRPHLTINLTMKVVNAFLGEHEKQRPDIQFLPRRDGTSQIATILTKLTSQILEDNSYDHREAQLLQDGLILDRGYLDVRMQFEDNMQGDISIQGEDAFDIIPDPDAKSPDPEEWNDVILTRWMTPDDVEAHYGKEHRDAIVGMAETDREFGNGQDSIRYDGTRTFGSEFSPLASEFGSPDFEEEDCTVRSIRVIERQYKKLTVSKYYVDPITGETSLVPENLSDEDILRVAETAQVGVIQKQGYRIRWNVIAGSHLIHDEWSPYRSFTVVPYFPYFRRGKASGIVRQLISPQEQHNKYESQMLHVVNTSANSGWTYETGSLANMDADELEQRGAETGLVLEYKRGATAPAKILPNQIPSGLQSIADRTRQAISEISGFPAVAGDSTVQEAADVPLQVFQTQNLPQLQVPFQGLHLTRELLGRKILELIQDFYTETRVLRITNWEDLQSGQEEIIVNLFNAAGEVVNALGVGKYSVAVSTAPSRKTFQKAQFAEALLLRQSNVAIPDEHIIRLSNLEGRHMIADQVASLQGTAPPSEQEQQISQMQLEMQMREAEANIGDLEAQMGLKQAQAMLAMAKAKSAEGAEELEGAKLSVQYQMEIAKLQAKLTEAREEMAMKVRIATIHSSAKREGEMLSNATKSFGTELQTRVALTKIAADTADSSTSGT